MKNLFFHNFNTAIIRFAFFGLDGCLVCVEIDVERHKALLVQGGKHVPAVTSWAIAPCVAHRSITTARKHNDLVIFIHTSGNYLFFFRYDDIRHIRAFLHVHADIGPLDLRKQF